MDFSDKNCAYCGKKFETESDIVVCPKCGNYYHRDCYHKKGSCDHKKVFDNGHGRNTEESQKSKKCKACGCENPENALFCDKCGAGFFEDTESKNEQGYVNFGGTTFNLNLDKTIDKNSSIDGVKLGDISDFVQSNSPYYLYVFNQLKKFKLNRFNFSAFLFTGGWLLYRKNYKLGLVISVIIAFLTLASGYICYYYYDGIFSDIYNISGVDLDKTSFTSMDQFRDVALGLGISKVILLFLPVAFLFIKWAIMIIIGFNANKIYLKNIIKTIRKIKNDSKSDIEYKKRLKEKGGVNVPLGICLFACYLVVNFLPQYLVYYR